MHLSLRCNHKIFIDQEIICRNIIRYSIGKCTCDWGSMQNRKTEMHLQKYTYALRGISEGLHKRKKKKKLKIPNDNRRLDVNLQTEANVIMIVIVQWGKISD